MEVTVDKIKELREKTGVGIMDCKRALTDSNGDLNAAVKALKERGFEIAQKKSGRALGSGLVEAYMHAGGRIGAMIEINCETDFVARTDDFKTMAHDIAMQVAANNPQYLSAEEAPEGEDPEDTCLLSQPFIKDPQKTIQEIIVETVSKVGENIRISKFCRFEIGA
ncbi:MAG: elongation factor Ts [Chloroflexi bacterium]|nr:elongation factor Ts [Chloroflexota bacterium]